MELKNQQIEEDRDIISQQAAELRNMDNMKNRFFANISHELRTPVTLISTPISHIMKQHQEALSEDVKHTLSLAQQNAGKLIGLIEELLELSQLESGQLELDNTPVQMNLFLKQLMSAYESMATIKEIDLILDDQLKESKSVLLDRNHLSRILNNLLSNALKFTPKGGKVKCEVRNRKLEDETHKPIDGEVSDFLEILVTDTGRGIPPEDLPHIFDRYFQTRREDIPKEGGTGIGLALSRELARLMGGRLEVESEWGKGSTFSLYLPIQWAAAPSTGTIADTLEAFEIESKDVHSKPVSLQKVDTSGLTKANILIVEDNPDMQQLLLSILQNSYNCRLANNGLEAWTLLDKEETRAQDVDLILSDIMMPQMDGYALLEHIKAHERWKQHPVLMLTARAAKEDKLRALNIGVDDYLTKPFLPDELLAHIANLLQHYRQRQAFNAVLSQEEEPQTLGAAEVWLMSLEEATLEALDKQQELTASFLANKAFLSERQLLRRLKQLTGLSTKQFIQEARLQRARHLLENKTFITMAEVAFAVGFKAPHHFSTVFYKRFGKRPSTYL